MLSKFSVSKVTVSLVSSLPEGDFVKLQESMELTVIKEISLNSQNKWDPFLT